MRTKSTSAARRISATVLGVLLAVGTAPSGQLHNRERLRKPLKKPWITRRARSAAAGLLTAWLVGLLAPAPVTAIDPGLEYLGQEPPGVTPVRFGPDSLLADSEHFWHASPVFSPALDEMHWAYYYREGTSDALRLLTMEVADEAWGPLHSPSFANPAYDENCPAFSVSGDSLYFLSDRPERGIYLVTRDGEDWSAPTRIDLPVAPGTRIGWQFAVTRDASVYFEQSNEGQLDIHVTRPVAGQYLTAEPLAGINTTANEFMPCLDPDERTLVFLSNRPGGYGYHDLWVSFRDACDGWTTPQNLGPAVNGPDEDGWPVLSPDGRYFFFTSTKSGDLDFNPSWVDIAVIEALRPVPTAVGEDVPRATICRLEPCRPNPFRPSTRISFTLSAAVDVDLRIHDAGGRLVRSLLTGVRLPPGLHGARWNGRDDSGRRMPSGIYFCRLDAGGQSTTTKLLLAN